MLQSYKQNLALRTSKLCSCVTMMLLATSCNRTTPPDTRQSDEQSIRALDSQWSRAAGAHDLDATLAFYADDAVLLPPDEPLAADKAAIRASWAGAQGAFQTLSWEVKTIEVAQSGDLAYVTGTWKGILKGPNSTTSPATGKLLEVWKKQPNGEWKCVADTYNSDAPPH